jgi:hypothetical protein
MLLMKLLRRKYLRTYKVKLDIHLFSVERTGGVAPCILKTPVLDGLHSLAASVPSNIWKGFWILGRP